MTKDELVKATATDTGMSQADIETALDGVTATLTEHVGGGGDEVDLGALGRFYIHDIPAHTGYNVATRQEEELPAHKRVIFHASAKLHDAVNA